MLQAPHRYGNSRAIWDHTVLPATRQRWHSRHYPSQLRLILDLATPEGCVGSMLPCIWLVPSGESYGGNRRPGGKLTACSPGSALGPTFCNEYGRALTKFQYRRLWTCDIRLYFTKEAAVKCMLYNCLEWYKWVFYLYHERQLYNTLIPPSHESPAIGLRISRLSGSVS